MAPPFERSVFINCPFDDQFAPILKAISFCVVYLGFFPRLAPENADNAAARLDRIVELVAKLAIRIQKSIEEMGLTQRGGGADADHPADAVVDQAGKAG